MPSSMFDPAVRARFQERIRSLGPDAQRRWGRMTSSQMVCHLEAFGEHRTFFTKRMFGGLAAYLFDRQMLLLVEPTKSGRWHWHGVLVCTDHEHHASTQAEFPALMPHAVLRKWLFIDSTHEKFESTMEAVAKHVASNDPRFGVLPKSPKPRRRKHIGVRRLMHRTLRSRT